MDGFVFLILFPTSTLLDSNDRFFGFSVIQEVFFFCSSEQKNG